MLFQFVCHDEQKTVSRKDAVKKKKKKKKIEPQKIEVM